MLRGKEDTEGESGVDRTSTTKVNKNAVPFVPATVFFTSLNLRILGLFAAWYQEDLVSAETYAGKGSSSAAPAERPRAGRRSAGPEPLR